MYRYQHAKQRNRQEKEMKLTQNPGRRSHGVDHISKETQLQIARAKVACSSLKIETSDLIATRENSLKHFHRKMRSSTANLEDKKVWLSAS